MLENKIAVVTGAGGTLCSEIAVELAKAGATVFLIGRTEEKLVRTAERIAEAGGKPPVIYPCDVTDSEAVAALAERVAEVGGAITSSTGRVATMSRRCLPSPPLTRAS